MPSVRDHTLLHPIGRGAYGEVWLARNVVGTLRAVKVVRRADFSEAHPFEREFKGIQKFEPVSRGHDGLVDILQIGRNDAEGYFYYVMELADSIGKAVQGSKFQVQGSLFAEVQTSKSNVQDPSTLNLEPETLNAFVPPPSAPISAPGAGCRWTSACGSGSP